MHNVKRFTAAQRAERRRENEERAQKYNQLSRAAMERRAAKVYDQESLAVAAKVLTTNCDFATLWNFRREVLEAMYPEQSDADQTMSLRRAACEAELALTQECLGYNPKSYPVWWHREWVLKWGRCSWQWAVELKLTSKLLALDDRNFHCWTYRRAVVQLAGVAAAAELAFTTSKIEANFSNYSAWHYRSKLLPIIHDAADGATDGAAALRPALLAELALVRNAFFTAPEDSSAWFYHRWLIAQIEACDGTLAPPADAAGPPARPRPSEQHAALLRDELAMVDELVELEPDSKWPLATAVFLAAKLRGDDPAVDSLAEERLAALGRVDPPRAPYYAHQLSVLTTAA